MGVIGNIGGTKVNRVISGADTVGTGCYAQVSYVATGSAPNYGSSIGTVYPLPPIVKTFGPGQSIPASFTQAVPYSIGPGATSVTMTWTLSSGVEFSNT